MIQIREATIADADELAQAHIEGWRVGYRGLFPDEWLDAPAFAQERIDRWRAWTFRRDGDAIDVAVIDARVVGFAHVGPERDNPVCDQSGAGPVTAFAPGERGEVYAFYFHPDAWGTGAADRLMERAEERLTAAGFTEAVLWVLRDNPRARRFYERHGWQPSGRTTMWDGPASFAHPPEPVHEAEYRRRFEA